MHLLHWQVAAGVPRDKPKILPIRLKIWLIIPCAVTATVPFTFSGKTSSLSLLASRVTLLLPTARYPFTCQAQMKITLNEKINFTQLICILNVFLAFFNESTKHHNQKIEIIYFWLNEPQCKYGFRLDSLFKITDCNQICKSIFFKIVSK